MRINLGNKVEAWCGDPSMGGWRLGVVVWGNGHQYNIRWDGGDVVSGRIRRVSVRPPPPHIEIPADLEAGDLVEALDDRMWKLAELVRAAGDGDGELAVKIVGSPSAITVPRSMVRVRQVLTDGDIWVATYKGEEIPGAREPTARPNAAANRRAPAAAAKHRPAADQFVPPPASSSHQWAKIKRSRHAMDHDAVGEVRRVEANSKRIRAMEEEEGELFVEYGNVEVIHVNQPTAVFVNKQQEMSDDEESDDDAKSVSSAGSGRSRESDGGSNSESDSDGSSSETDNGDHAAARSPPGEAQGANQPPPSQPQGPQHVKEERADDVDDDMTKSRATAMQPRPAVAAMQRHLANERPPAAAAAAEVGEQIHRLEVDAYAALMKVFHATGALTWEKEELLTQLRLHLHVSGDEHLQLIRALNGGRRRPPKPEN
uniref:ENT domain-containing protein n=1 Tax=Oryza punctata TaxID=4537 RepID=A0A0E0JL28_ORYPU